MSPIDNDHLHILGHVIGLSAADPETWTCSCGFRGGVGAMADHMAGDIAGQIEGKLAEAKDHGLIPLKGD